MTLEIALTFAILGGAILLFVSERLRADLTAMFVLVALVVSGLVHPTDAISGFSNPAVVAIWAVFILSAGLARTGIAGKLGDLVMRFSGKSERRLLSILMTSSAFLSAFMNNVGVAAMFLPVTIDIARRTRRASSRLLLPMAYGTLLGGMLVLIGTAPNLIVSGFLGEAGLRPLGLFDFTPIGLVILLAVVVYMNLLGHRLLPDRQTPRPLSAANGSPTGWDARRLYGLEERLAYLVLPPDSPLAGKTLAESRIGRALGLNILSVERATGGRLSPDASLVLAGGDKLLALGRLDQFEQLSNQQLFSLESGHPTVERLLSEHIILAEYHITPDSPLKGKNLVESKIRQRFGVYVLAIRRGEAVRRANLQHFTFELGDYLLVEGLPNHLEALFGDQECLPLSLEQAKQYHLDERLLIMNIPEGSPFAGLSLEETRLGAGYGITVLCILREGEDQRLPEPSAHIQAGDQLIVSGRPVDIEALRSLQSITIQRNIHVDLEELEDGPLSIVEVMLSPYTTKVGKTLSELHFREKYGISVLAIWRGERSYRTGLADFPLQYGDAFLCYGPRQRFSILASDRDFIVLKLDVQEAPRLNKAPWAALIMLGVVTVVLINLLPISVAAIAGAAFMVLTGCLTMDEAYRAIEWRAVFLIAAMLPLGIAMQHTGAAALLANAVIQLVGSLGPTAILGGLMLLTMLTNQFVPSAVNAVVMAPIALATAANLGVSPYPFMMGVAYSVATSFMTPVSHPANVLVMSPGGYRFSDYVKNGLPIAVIVWLVSVTLLPVVFPF